MGLGYLHARTDRFSERGGRYRLRVDEATGTSFASCYMQDGSGYTAHALTLGGRRLSW